MGAHVLVTLDQQWRSWPRFRLQGENVLVDRSAEIDEGTRHAMMTISFTFAAATSQ
jgi:hypothetical protein